MHYEVEVRTNAGEWLGINKRYKLLGDASLRAAQGEDRGCVARVVRVAGDGAREVVGARARVRVAARAAEGTAAGRIGTVGLSRAVTAGALNRTGRP